VIQRLRIRFSRGEAVKYISHLDLMRLWQRALLRAGISLAYSEGFNPHPKMSLAAPLAVGVTSEAELMDIMLVQPVSPHNFTAALGQQLPEGINISQVQPVALTLPSLPAQVRFAEYEVDVATEKKVKEVEAMIRSLLALDKLPWEHQRDTGPKRYDLRALVDDIWLVECRETICTIGMRLRCDSTGSGRPEQVASALGFDGPPCSMHRTRLILGN
jgi:radical SAM-linked protein